MRRILVPIDFSDQAWNAMVYAMELYKNLPCEFHILHVYDVSTTQLLTTVSAQKVGHLYDIRKKESKEGLKKTLEDINNSNPSANHSFITVSESGFLETIIKDMVASTHYHMILMGTKGATGTKALFLGSNTHKVIKAKVNCPILMIPEEACYHGVSNIAFATNFERTYHKNEIRPLIDLAENQDATVRMIHVYPELKMSVTQYYNSTVLEQYFKKVSHEFHVISDFSTIEKAIQAFVEELEIDVLTMIHYTHGFVERLMRESVVKKITFHTNIPFLVIPEQI